MADQKRLTIITNRHPSHAVMETDWLFFKQSYVGGRAYVTEQNLFKYYKEGDEEFKSRMDRAYRENHSKRVVDLINTYLFKEAVTREAGHDRVQQFWENTDGKGSDIKKFMKSVSMWASVFGRVYVVCDKRGLPESEQTGTAKDDLDPRAQPYLYVVEPHNVLDIAFDDQTGAVKWALIREVYRDDSDPFTASTEVSERYRLWQVGKWTLYSDAGEQIGEGTTGLDIVPIVPVDNEEMNKYDGQSLIGDIAYIDRAIFNDWSRLDVIINDQTFSQLIMPIEGLPPDVIEDAELREKYMQIGTKRIVLYSASAMKEPCYISPDATQAEFILKKIEKQIKQLYAIMGLQAETATEVAERQSGAAKAYDFDKLNKLMASKADNLEDAEHKIIKIAQKWMGIDVESRIDYPENFDVKSLAYEISIAQELALLGMSATFMKEIKKSISLKAMNRPSKDTIKKVVDEIENMSEEEATSLKTNAFDFDGKNADEKLNSSNGKNDRKGGKAAA